MRWLAPARRRGVEVLDDPATPDDLRQRAMADIARSNRLFGGTRAVTRGLDTGLRGTVAPRVLDVGIGTGDIAREIGRRHPDATILGVDMSESLLRVARLHVAGVAAGTALRLPVRDRSIDVVVCSQLLHHFEDPDAAALIRELHRVSRRRVIVADIRRSWLAAIGFWAASSALRFHPVTRHDGVVSVLRGFTAAELRSLVHTATGIEPVVDRGAFWRLTASWSVPPAGCAAGYT